MLDSGNLVDGGNKFAPAGALCGQDFSAIGGETIIAASALARFFDPTSPDPAALLQAIKQGIERSDVELDDATGAALDQTPDVVTVPRLSFDQRKDEQFGAALLKLAIANM